ncbi:MAG: hypothetical protein MUD01_10555 [Chloroflexaceae bacterium]|jgi:hypothetical protein|nr:hypothetical protein [Chloroflexaceae bacterium]
MLHQLFSFAARSFAIVGPVVCAFLGSVELALLCGVVALVGIGLTTRILPDESLQELVSQAKWVLEYADQVGYLDRQDLNRR